MDTSLDIQQKESGPQDRSAFSNIGDRVKKGGDETEYLNQTNQGSS
jgi:hypothetical protein